MNSSITVRIDDKQKRDFAQIVGKVGLDAPSVIRLFIKQTINQNAIPLSLNPSSEKSISSLPFLDTVRADWGEW